MCLHLSVCIHISCQSQWPYGLRCRSAAAWLLGSRVRIPLGALYAVLSCVGRGLCDGLITCPEESYRMPNCMCDHRNPKRGSMFKLGTYRKNDDDDTCFISQIVIFSEIWFDAHSVCVHVETCCIVMVYVS
jgi:hypothetical protein